MDGSDDVEGVLENLAGAGVDHGPLKIKLVIESEAEFGLGVWWESYESGGLARHPGDEDNLGAVRTIKSAWCLRPIANMGMRTACPRR